MKLIHLSDLHLGKRVNDFSMLEDQKYILDEILKIIDDEAPDGVMIAGDIYDKSVPSAEAVQIFDDFLNKLADRKLQVFADSGNHDSAERLSFGGKLMDRSGIHLAPVYNGSVEPFVLSDKFGSVNIYMLPFIKPVTVRRFFADNEINDYTDAVKIAIDNFNADFSVRNVIVAHQFVTGAERCESEEVTVGGLDNVNASVFDGFDYVALGHIHGPQSLSADGHIRYCGTPLKYSFSEVKHYKSVTVVELFEKGKINIRTVPLSPLREMSEIRGEFADVVSEKYSAQRNNYLRITLTNETEITDGLARLRAIYPYIMKFGYDNTRTRHDNSDMRASEIDNKTTEELFSEFFFAMQGKELSDRQTKYIKKILAETEEEK